MSISNKAISAEPKKTLFLIAPSLYTRWFDIISELNKRGCLIASSGIADEESSPGLLDIKANGVMLMYKMRRAALYMPNRSHLEELCVKYDIRHLIYWGDASHLAALICSQIKKNNPSIKYTIRAAQNIENAVPAPFKWYINRVLGLCDNVISVAPPSTKIIKKHLRKHNKVIEVGNGYDSVVFNNREDVRVYDLVYCGHFEYRKGINEVIECIELLFQSHSIKNALVIGHGSHEGSLRGRLSSYIDTGNVEVMGWLSPKQLSDMFNKSKVLILPSKENVRDSLGLLGGLFTVPWTEQFGRVVVEAQACGVVPIVTNVGGLPFAVGEAGVVLQKNCKSTDIADAVRALLDDSSHYNVNDLLKGNASRFELEAIVTKVLD